MTTLPTSTAVSSAVRHYRELRQLTRDELSHLMRHNGHHLNVEEVRGIEQRLTAATVDDLTALAYALDVTPADLLGHTPIDQPVFDGSAATGLPEDVQQAELRAWLSGSTDLDAQTRLSWHQQLITDLQMKATHIEDQLHGAQEEISSLGVLAIREAEMPPVQRLKQRVRQGEHEIAQIDVALAMAQQRLEELQEPGVA